MRKLTELEQQDDILLKEDLAEMIQPVSSLPTPSEAEEGNVYVLTTMSESLPGKIYHCVKQDDVYVWEPLAYKETGALTGFGHVWAKSVVHDQMATVCLHWKEPEDYIHPTNPETNAVWHHTVIVRKKGSGPSNILDGEIVGYSSVRDQYAGERAFVDSVPSEDLKDYKYHIYSVTRFGVVSGENGTIHPILTWKKFQELIRQGDGPNVVRIGDILPVNHKVYGEIELQVAAFDNAVPDDSSLTHSVTLIANEVLQRMPYDYEEKIYALSRRTTKVTDDSVKYYIKKSDGTFEQVLVPQGLIPVEQGWYEKNDLTEAQAAKGRSNWKLSDARGWLNSEEANYVDTATGFEYDHPRPGFLNGFKDTELGDPEFLEVLAPVKVKTTDPSQPTKTIETIDRSFLPSYYELYGEVPTRSTVEPRPAIIVQPEGLWFDLYRTHAVINHQHKILHETEPTAPETGRTWTKYASWYTRTPDTSVLTMVFATNNSDATPNNITIIGDNGCLSRFCHLSDEDIKGKGSYYREIADGTTLWQVNLAPGYSPCFVIA